MSYLMDKANDIEYFIEGISAVCNDKNLITKKVKERLKAVHSPPFNNHYSGLKLHAMSKNISIYQKRTCRHYEKNEKNEVCSSTFQNLAYLYPTIIIPQYCCYPSAVFSKGLSFISS